ncbi:DUF3592 domain-containing protein [Streptomyces sp. NPDC057686]|uniref:DUF3592 domain-containing protein n=1 Tax=Streptomyces sp. NPDC057686 TaxID=3346212 RepID=UPI00367D9490
MLVVLSSLIGLLVLGISAGVYIHSSPLLKRGVRTSAVCVSIGQVAHGSMLLLEYTPRDGPARRYAVGPFVFPPVEVGGRMEVVYDPKRPQEVSLPERLPKSTRGLAIAMTVSGAVVAAGVAVALTYRW